MRKIAAILLSFLMMANLAVFTSFAQSADVEITSLETLPEKQWGYLEGVAVSAPEAAATNTNIAGVTLTPVWEGSDGFNFGDKPEGNELVAYTATYTAPDGYVFADALAAATENTTLSADKKVLTYKFYTYVIPSDAIYIDDKGTNSTDDYAEGNLARPYGTIDYAMDLLESKGGGVIVIVDKVTETASGKISESITKKGHYTIIGWDKDSTLETTGHYNLRGDMTIRDLNYIMSKKDGGIYLNGFSLTFGDKNYTDLTVSSGAEGTTKQIFMTGDGGTFTRGGKLTINSGDFTSVFASGWNQTTINANLEYEMNGGSLSNLHMGLHCGNSGKLHSITGDIRCTINGGTINTLSMGSSGVVYKHTGNAYLTVNGGTVGNIRFRSANANKVLDDVTYPIQNGDYTLKINGGTITGSITDTTADGVGVTGYTLVDLVDYTGDRAALLGKIKVDQFDEVRAQVVYVDAVNGAAGNNGLTPKTALPTMTDAFKKFANGVAGKIIICGEYNTTSGMTDTSGRGHVTISTAEGGKLIMSDGITMMGDTTYENFNIGIAAKYKNLFAGGYKLIMGENVTITNDGGGFLQIGNGGYKAVVAKSDIEIHSGTYGLIYSGADFNGGRVTGDAILKICGGTFTGEIYVGGYVSSDKYSVSDDTSGKIDGMAGLYVDGGTFQKPIFIGGQQYGTVDSVEAKISGGTFNSNINVGPVKPSGTYTPADGEATNYSTNILGNAIVEITGGTFTGKIAHTGNAIDGKAVVLASNGTAVTVTNPEKFDYVVLAGKKGTTTYDATSDKFGLVPVSSAIDIYINDVLTTKSSDNIYTLSGAENNLYTVNYGGEAAVQAQFIITQPIAELTPIKNVINTGGKNTYNEIGNCTVSNATWEPAHNKFEFDTQYKATVALTALEGVEFSDDFSGININNRYAGNKAEYALSEDKTQITVTITFPKTEKSDLDILAEKETNVRVIFTTNREGTDEQYFHDTTVTLTNVKDDEKSVSGKATEDDQNGKFETTVARGIYNIKVSKAGYLDAVAEAVMIDSDNTFTIDLGALIPGDIIGSKEKTGDGVVDIDDFVIILRGLAPDTGIEIKSAADINESGVINVTQLGHVKSSFSKTASNDAKEYAGLFENTYYRLTVDKELNVGYIGGSIIQGASEQGTQTYNNGGFVPAGNEKFIDRMQKNFEKNFPDAKIYSINAGISDTGSNFGLFRLAEDMMLREEGHIPDLVFLEFCVNDFGSIGLERIELQYESLINAVYKINPKADIVCMLTAMGGYDIPKAAHINVANHYNIPIVDVGAALRKDYDIAGDCKVFTNDNLHPNGAGYEYYTKLCWNLLEKYIVYATPEAPKYEARVLPEQYKSGVIMNPAKIPVTDESVILSEGSSWKTEANKVMSRIFNAQTKVIPCITSSTAGDAITFKFTGDAFGFIIKQSPAMGSFEYSVDGGSWVEFKSSKSYVHYQTYLMETGLDNKEHTVTVRVTGTGIGTQVGCEVGIAGILYNDLSE